MRNTIFDPNNNKLADEMARQRAAQNDGSGKKAADTDACAATSPAPHEKLNGYPNGSFGNLL